MLKEQQESPVAGVSEQGGGGRGSRMEREVEWEKVGGGEGLCLGHHWVLPIMGLAYGRCSLFGRGVGESVSVLAATSRDGGHTEVQVRGHEHSPACLRGTWYVPGSLANADVTPPGCSQSGGGGNTLITEWLCTGALMEYRG